MTDSFNYVSLFSGAGGLDYSTPPTMADSSGASVASSWGHGAVRRPSSLHRRTIRSPTCSTNLGGP